LNIDGQKLYEYSAKCLASLPSAIQEMYKVDFRPAGNAGCWEDQKQQ
jgi:hypothetical protein